MCLPGWCRELRPLPCSKGLSRVPERGQVARCPLGTHVGPFSPSQPRGHGPAYAVVLAWDVRAAQFGSGEEAGLVPEAREGRGGVAKAALSSPVCHRAGEAPAYQREPGGFRQLPSKAVGNLLVEVLGKLKISPRFARFPPPPSPAPCCPHSFFVINSFRFRQCLSFGLRQAHWLNH